MLSELDGCINDYLKKWERFVQERKDPAFFGGLKPTAVGWKTEDFEDFDHRLAQLKGACNQLHLGWVNERWLATLYLKDVLAGGVRIIKLMQRRPGSTDEVGLDHVDFAADTDSLMAFLRQEPEVKWTEERNGDHCHWTSIWFAGTEAKFRPDTVLATAALELGVADRRIVG